MAYRKFGTKPSSEQMQNYCESDPEKSEGGGGGGGG